jgi:type II secretory pathway pseudopilin PulG
MIHLVVGVLAAILVALIAGTLVLSPLQNAERARIERLRENLKESLETYRQANGSYPDSLQAVASPSWPQKGVVYNHIGSGYEVSFEGRWYSFALSVSNSGARCDSRLKAR